MLRFAPPFRGRYIASTRGGVTENIARVGVSVLTTCAAIVAHEGSATVSTSIAVTASGQQTDQQHFGTATVGVAISSTVVGQRVTNGSANIGVDITATADGSTTTPIQGAATCSIVITATADGLVGTLHSSTADCQVNISASANGFNSDTTITDETSNGNNMVMSGTAWTFVSDAAVGSRSLNLTGVTGEHGTIDESYLSLLRSPWSFSCWYKPSEGNISGSYYPTLIYTAANGTYGGSLYQMYHHGRKLRWQSVIDFSGAFTQRDTSSDVFSSGSGNDWVHIVVTIDNVGDPTMYIDGSAVTLTTDSTPNTSDISNYSNTSDIRIGQVTSNINLDYKIDDVSLWSKELSSTEVSNIYNSGSGSSLTGSSDLAGWWKMGDSNVVATTHSGTASCQVNLSASASGSVSSPVAYSNSYGIQLDGSNDYAPVVGSLSAGTYNFLTSTLTYSASLWFKFDDHTQNSSQVLLANNYTGSNKGIQIWYDNRSGISTKALRVNSWAGSSVSTNTASAITDNNWHHVLVTSSGASGTLTVYLDGSSLATASLGSVSSTAPNQDLAIGGRVISGSVNSPIDGKLDEVAIWDVALSSADATAIYNSGAPNNLTTSGSYDTDRSGDLQGYWRFEENTGTSIADTSGNGNTITLTNGPTFSTDVPFINKYSLLFDGTNDYLDIGSLSALSSASSFSVSFWFKNNGNFSGNVFGGWGSSSNNNIGLNPNYTGNIFYFVVRAGSAAGSLSVSSLGTYAPSNNWNHFVCTFDGGDRKIFINGTQRASDTGVAPSTTSSSAGDNVAIGRRETYYAKGYIDEVALYSSSLSQSEVTDIYNSGTPDDRSNDSNLLGYWRMEEGSGTTVADLSGNSNTATLTNGTTFSTIKP